MKSPSNKCRIFSNFIHNESSIRHFVSKLFNNRNDIDDILQETFLRTFEADKKNQIHEPKAYLYRVARNVATSYRSNKHSRFTEYLEELDIVLDWDKIDNCVESNLYAQQKLGIYCEAIANLSPQIRKVVLLRKVYDLPVKEIADRLDLSASTVEKHLAKGIRHCNKAIQIRLGDTAVNRHGTARDRRTP